MSSPQRAVELHRSTGRASDRLLLQDQDQVAASLRYDDADALMAAIAEAGRTIAWGGDDVWRRQAMWSPGPRRRGQRARRRPQAGISELGDGAAPDGIATGPSVTVEPGIRIVGAEHGAYREVALEPGVDGAADITVGLRLAAVAAERGLPISRSSLDVLADTSPSPPDPWPDALRNAAGAGAGRRARPQSARSRHSTIAVL